MRLCSIVPPYVLRSIAENGDDDDRVRARIALAMTAQPRRERMEAIRVAGMLLVPRRSKKRTVFDAAHERELPGRIVRAEGAARSRDVSVNEAYDAAGRTYDYFRRVHGRHSLDDRGMRLESTVHFGDRFNNAHWNGRQMIYGDGDGKYFRSFTACIDVVAHELTHGVTQYAAGLGASGQCGALAEHFSDVFGLLVKQYWRGETAATSDWLVGGELLTDRVHGVALRSMKNPGSAFDDRVLGRDPQPKHMRNYVRTSGDDRGVHVNSGIPNHAFYLAATMIGGKAWETVGRIWYVALTTSLSPRATFQQCADATAMAAARLFGDNSEPHDAVRHAWKSVGLIAAAGERLQIRRMRKGAAGAAPEPYEPPAAGAERPLLV